MNSVLSWVMYQKIFIDCNFVSQVYIDLFF
jgi:hypothetical protein